MAGTGAFTLGDWRVEPAANTVTCGEESLRLEPKVMDVLVCLARRAAEVVPKREIIDEVWRTEFITDKALTRAVGEIRRALGDDARNPTYIRTIPTRGYQLLVEVVPDGHTTDACLPAFLSEEISEREKPVFVARETELNELEGRLDQALDGHGSVAFVTGEAGAGKTALLLEFCRRAQEQVDDLVVAAGACNTATGAGDPYGPWQQLLSQLAGDVDVQVARGALGGEAARRLWGGLPPFAEAVVSSGRDLVETLIGGSELATRAAAAFPDAPWLGELEALVQRKLEQPPGTGLQQGAVFLQSGRVLRAVAEKTPMVLVIDDLHWADSASLALLCDLGRQLEGSRLVLVGAYRPEDVSLGRGGKVHPLVPVLAELQRTQGDVAVDVGRTGGREFVNSFIDTEENRLDHSFREEFFDHSRGNALFTVELLRTLQDREMVVRDEQGLWVATESLDWTEIPARVEGVVAARINRLPDELRDLLAIASVEGKDFTAEVVARVGGAETRDTIHHLSRELENRHRLVESRGVRSLTSGRISRFGFSHVLFQRFVYNTLNSAERARLHEDVGRALETLFGERCGEIAVQLAHHFQEAGLVDKAIHYLTLAGGMAARKAANVEALDHLRRALDFLATFPASAERDQQELLTRMTLFTPLVAMKGWGEGEVGETARRALELSQRVGDDGLVCTTLHCLSYHHSCRAEFGEAESLAERMLEMAEARDDELLAAIARWTLSWPTFSRGALEAGRRLLEDAIAVFDAEDHGDLRFVYGIDPRAVSRANLSIVLMALGYPEAAYRRIDEAESIAQRLDHPVSESFVMVCALIAWSKARNYVASRVKVDRLLDIANQYSLPVEAVVAKAWDAALRAVEDGADVERGPEVLAVADALDKLQFLWQGSGLRHIAVLELAALGRFPEALAASDLAMEFAEAHDERMYEAPILAGKGELLMALGEFEEAEANLTRALEVARKQNARYWELLAATPLAGLWHAQGRTSEARELLEPVYEWFTEGHDTEPMVEARKLLEELKG